MGNAGTGLGMLKNTTVTHADHYPRFMNLVPHLNSGITNTPSIFLSKFSPSSSSSSYSCSCPVPCSDIDSCFQPIFQYFPFLMAMLSHLYIKTPTCMLFICSNIDLILFSLLLDLWSLQHHSNFHNLISIYWKYF